MRLLLLHNPTAGARQLRREDLIALAEDAAWEVSYQSTDERNWPDALVGGGYDLVVAAGGDGTVRKAATRLAALRATVPLAIVPLGTANNVARSLGITGTPQELIAGWQQAQQRRFDVGVLRAPWTAGRFVEAVGIGVFARMIRVLRSGRDGRERPHAASMDSDLARGLRALQRLLRRAPAHRLHMRLDGRPLDGDYLLVEAMNVPIIGPHLALAPQADPSDGLLDVVLVHADERAAFAEYLADRLQGGRDAPMLTVHRGRQLELAWDGAPVHRDDRLWPRGAAERRQRCEEAQRRAPTLHVRLGRAIRILVAG